jgi:transposase
VIAPCRGGEVIDAFLAAAEPEVWGSEMYAPQIQTPVTALQVCLTHQERDLTFAAEADTGEDRLWAIELRHMFGRAIRCIMRARRSRPRCSRAAGRSSSTPPIGSCSTATSRRRPSPLASRIGAHRDSLYVFLHRDDVESANNSSERDLRPSVIHRKVICSFWSVSGAEASAIRTTILAPAHKQDQNALDALHLFRPSQPAHSPNVGSYNSHHACSSY